jgi:SH2 domain
MPAEDSVVPRSASSTARIIFSLSSTHGDTFARNPDAASLSAAHDNVKLDPTVVEEVRQLFSSQDPSERVLSPLQRSCFLALCQLFGKILAYESENRMTLEAVVRIFTPTLHVFPGLLVCAISNCEEVFNDVYHQTAAERKAAQRQAYRTVRSVFPGAEIPASEPKPTKRKAPVGIGMSRLGAAAFADTTEPEPTDMPLATAADDSQKKAEAVREHAEHSDWWLGDFPRERAAELLLSCKTESFLVRRSSQPGCFAVSRYITVSGELSHFLLHPREPPSGADDDSAFCAQLVLGDRESEVYDGLTDFVERCKELVGFLPVKEAQRLVEYRSLVVKELYRSQVAFLEKLRVRYLIFFSSLMVCADNFFPAHCSRSPTRPPPIARTRPSLKSFSLTSPVCLRATSHLLPSSSLGSMSGTRKLRPLLRSLMSATNSSLF